MVYVLISRYRLAAADLKTYLVEQFPGTNIEVQEKDDDYGVELPGKLTQKQENAVDDLRRPAA